MIDQVTLSRTTLDTIGSGGDRRDRQIHIVWEKIRGHEISGAGYALTRAGLQAEHFHIPGLKSRNIIRREVVMNVVHLDGRGERRIAEYFDVNAFRSRHISLIVKARSRGLRHF